MQLTLEQADRILQAAVAKAEQLGIKVEVAVCDGGARFLAYNRMDGAPWSGIHGGAALGKAVASVQLGTASGNLESREGTPMARAIAAGEGGHALLKRGAVPIFLTPQGAYASEAPLGQPGYEVLGACGVNGATGEQEEEVARVGVAALNGK